MVFGFFFFFHFHLFHWWCWKGNEFVSMRVRLSNGIAKMTRIEQFGMMEFSSISALFNYIRANTLIVSLHINVIYSSTNFVSYRDTNPWDISIFNPNATSVKMSIGRVRWPTFWHATMRQIVAKFIEIQMDKWATRNVWPTIIYALECNKYTVLLLLSLLLLLLLFFPRLSAHCTDRLQYYIVQYNHKTTLLQTHSGHMIY